MLNINSSEIDLIKNDWFFISDLFDFVCAANISNGNSRSVYNCQFDKTVVIKIERPDTDKGFGFFNVSEWDIWNNMKKYKTYLKFLAPCFRISGCGRILVQAKTIPIKKEQLPKLIPYWMADTKLENWGSIGKRIVCHDYANHKLFADIEDKKLIKPKWHSGK